MRLRQRLLLECSEPRRASRWSPEMSGDATASATDARRTSGRCCRSSGSLPNSGLSEREWHTQLVSVFRRGAGADDTLSQRELPHSRHTGTLQLHALLQHVRAVPFELLSSFSRRLKMSRKVKFEAFCDHAACGRLAHVQRMLDSGDLRGDGNLNEALVRAAENGHVDVVDCLLRHATMFDPSADENCAIRLAAANGHLAVVERLLQDERVDPSDEDNYAVRLAARNDHLAVVERLLHDVSVDPSARDSEAIQLAAARGHLAVVERLMQDTRVDPSDLDNFAVGLAAQNGHLAVLERLLQDERVDPSASNNFAIQWAAQFGHLAVVKRLLQDERVDPSADDNGAVRGAAQYGHLAVVDRLLDDDRVDAAIAIQQSLPEDRKLFECRERLTEICIALQDLELPAWVTVQILDAARPWSTLPLHSKWSLVCAVKHYHDKKQ